MRRFSLHLLFLLSALALLAGCDGGGGDTPDAAMSTPDAGPVRAPSTLFGPCEVDAQCPGEGAVCRTAAESGLPGGSCTVPCEDRTPCDAFGVYHHCVRRPGASQSYCERRCLNGIDCGREAYTCQPPPEGAPEGGICFGVCSSDEHCGSGTVCDVASGRCETSLPTSGGVTGDTCASPTDCRSGFCISEANGWPGGQCTGPCILPPGYNSTRFFTGDALPQGECPADQICLAVLGGLARGDYGACMIACTSPADCRTGYTCRNQFEGGAGVSTYSNGVCWPAG